MSTIALYEWCGVLELQLQMMTDMNLTGLGDVNDTFAADNRSDELLHRLISEQLGRSIPVLWEQWWIKFAMNLYPILLYVAYALGIPGNILSAIVWLRRHVTSESPSATYLSVLAITDLVCLLTDGILTKYLLPRHVYVFEHRVINRCIRFTAWSGSILEAVG